MRRFTGIRAIAFALSVCLAAGCGGDDPTGVNGGNGGVNGGGNGGGGGGGDTNSSFSATVTGDISASLSGFAFWGEASDPSVGDIFAVVMGDDSDPTAGTGGAISLFYGGARPGNGTYQIASNEELARTNEFPTNEFIATVAVSDPFAVGGAVSGTVRITSSSDSRVQGTFNAEVDVVLQDGSSGTVSVSGQFNAINGEVGPTPF